MGRFTKIPQDTFDQLQMDAGVLLKNFDPANPNIADADIITATTGGITVTCTPTFSDMGEDVDNCPNNTKELKHLDGWDCSLAFTALGVTEEQLKLELGCADVTSNKVTPRRTLSQSDFTDLWWAGDKTDGGGVAIKLMNALSTAGFSLKTTKNGKGQIGVTLTGHVSINSQDTVPMEFYVIDSETGVGVSLNKGSTTIAVNATETLVATKSPASATLAWSSSDTGVATVTSGGVVTGVAAGTAVIVAKASKSGQDAVATCTVTVIAGEG